MQSQHDPAPPRAFWRGFAAGPPHCAEGVRGAGEASGSSPGLDRIALLACRCCCAAAAARRGHRRVVC
eukprot:7635678-Heterocapsa_arctica.AAC.1